MAGPGLIIYVRKIACEFCELLFIDGNALVIGIGIMRMPFVQFIAELFLWVQAKTDLIKERAKAIVFEQLAIIRRVIVHAIQGFLKAFRNQSPPAIAFAKINGTVHSLHTAL